MPDGVLVVLDEAYIHYAASLNLQAFGGVYRKRKNLLILRTFSKVYGLAGMRIGFAIGRPELLSAMNKLRTPFNTSGVAQAAALAALDDREHVERCIATNASERKRLSEGLAKLGLRPVPSETNFIFMEVGPEAKEHLRRAAAPGSDRAAFGMDGISGSDPRVGGDGGRK